MIYRELTIRCNSKLFGALRKNSQISYLVFHYTANAKGDTAVNNAKYFQTGNLPAPASAHDFVDDDKVVHSVPYNRIAWHCGGGLQDQGSIYKKEGAKKFKTVTNSNSIGIEMCDCVEDSNHNLSPSTRSNAAYLGAKLMVKYKIPPSHLVRHFDVTGKLCPIYFVIDAEDWKEFKKEVLRAYLRRTKKITKSSGTYLIKRLQTKLNKISVSNAKLVVDGIYGEKTKSYLLSVWKKWHWNKTGKSSGWTAGNKTLKKLGLV